MLSSSARIDKSKRKKKKTKIPINNKSMHQSQDDEDNNISDDNSINSNTNHKEEDREPKKKRPKKKHSTKKLKQIHNEEIAAFRRRMGIRISNDNKHEMNVNLDPISSFKNWKCPSWWSMYGSVSNNNNSNSMKGGSSNNNNAMKLFNNIHQTILTNIEYGKWNEPTPIQMQSLPSLMERRDVMGCAPTGKSALVLFYHVNSCVQYDALVIWPLHLTFVYLYLIAFTRPHVLTYVTITSLST